MNDVKTDALAEAQCSYPAPRVLARKWPWITAIVAALIVDLLIGAARQFDFVGINGFSTVNYGWLAFALVGGIVFAWRLAGRRQSWLGLLRPLVPAVASYVICFVLVSITGQVFLPGQSLGETLTTDAPGRSLPVAIIVFVLAVVFELVRSAWRRVRRGASR